jgi:hypothetical protein
MYRSLRLAALGLILAGSAGTAALAQAPRRAGRSETGTDN